jgi:TRAP transporter 4TM/12TM fusion protein
LHSLGNHATIHDIGYRIYYPVNNWREFVGKPSAVDTTATEAQMVEAEKLLEKVDVEARYRKNFSDFWRLAIMVISSIFIGYHMITSGIGIPEAIKHRAIHVGFVLALVFLYYPGRLKSIRTRPSAVDLVLFFASVAVTIFTVIDRDNFLMRGGVATMAEYIVGGIMILLVLEACRRAVGPQLLILAVIFLLYAWLGKYIPGVFSHRGQKVNRIIYQMYLGGNGIFGLPIGVSSTYLIIFVILGAILEKSGLGKLFNDLALGLGGRLVGGPAKVAVVASALLGMISGSAATNVATTGAFTIPLMKKIGYKPHFAGAVEAAASTGGQIMPPIMGSAAFIMAEFLGMKYLNIAAAAVIPALLYFAGVYFQIDLRARKTGLKGLSKDDLPDVLHTVLRYGHMIIPIFVLIFLMMEGRTPLFSAFYTVLATAILSWMRKETRVGLKELKVIAVNSARGSLSIGVAMATAGFIIAVLSMTGIGIILSDNIVALSGGSLPIALVLVMVVSIILGMGLPTSACYVIAASISVPILTKLGVAPFQAHFFVFYYACLSTITPPVALAAYVAAGLSGAKSSKVGWTAFRLALAGFIVPFFFIYSPAMLLIDATALQIVWAGISGLIGTYFLSIAVEGFLKIDLPIWLRPVFFVAAIALIAPGIVTDLIGAGLAAVGFIYVFLATRARKVSVA